MDHERLQEIAKPLEDLLISCKAKEVSTAAEEKTIGGLYAASDWYIHYTLEVSKDKVSVNGHQNGYFSLVVTATDKANPLVQKEIYNSLLISEMPLQEYMRTLCYTRIRPQLKDVLGLKPESD